MKSQKNKIKQTICCMTAKEKKPSYSTYRIDKIRRSSAYQKKPEYRLQYLYACPGFSDRRILLLKKFFEKIPKIFGVFFKRQYCPAKSGKHHQLSNEKWGENVEPNRREFIKQCAFQKFCNTVLHNEACDAHKELHRHKAKEITFSDLTLEEVRQLHTFDEYFKGETTFERAGKKSAKPYSCTISRE